MTAKKKDPPDKTNVIKFPGRKELMIKDLTRSGLTEKDAQRMGLRELNLAETAHFTKKIKRPSYKIPYHDVNGKPLDFFRLRFLDDGKNFGQLEQRYWQKPNSLPLPYFSPLGKVKWPALITDPKQSLVLTEGEKKAAVACKAGIPCIGLGGVWSWRSKKHEIALLPELKAIKWDGREVFLAFDSDLERNTNVLHAARAFAHALTKQGAKVMQVQIPSGEVGENVGLDDWLLKHKPKAFWALPRESLAGDLGSQMELMNEELVYVEDQHTFYHLPTNKFVTATVLRMHTFASRNVIGFDEKGVPKTVNIFDEWSRWPSRRVIKCLTFAPGQPRFMESGALNTWPGWGVQPKRGNVKPWKELLDYIFADALPEHRRWFEQWLAYPLQHPGVKMYSSVLLWSLEQRVGKSLIGYTMSRIYGSGFSEISHADLTSAYNSWCVSKQFILADEVTSSDRRADADRLKQIITRREILVSLKYQPNYNIPDYVAYLFTSNHPDAFFLEDKDQRVFVHEIAGVPKPSSFYKMYDKWYKSTDGAAALFDYLLHVDLTGFNPLGHAPITVSKREMTEISRSDLDEFAMGLVDNADGLLRLNGQPIKRQLWTADELVAIFDIDGHRRTHRVAMGKALSRAGFKKAQIQTALGKKHVWFIVPEIRSKRFSHSKLLEIYEEEHAAAAAIADKPKKF